jgi:hypothetical protein
MSKNTFFENAFVGTESEELFQSPVFFRLHAQLGASYFELCNKGNTKALIHFSPVDSEGTWRSPAKGTFAGLSFSNDLKYGELLTFFKEVESSLRFKGAKVVEVLPAPQSHDASAFAQQVYLLKSLGFEIKRYDLNQSLAIDTRTLVERMSYGNLKRLRKCAREGLVARELELSNLPLVYETLAINRASKGNNMSMTLSQLQNMVEAFPKKILLFGCPHGAHLASAALCLKISSEVLYVFYWGDRPDYATYSPVVPLADAIYRYGQAQGFKILDVGTSTIDLEPNIGLLEFKRGLGFSESLKLVMRKTL